MGVRFRTKSNVQVLIVHTKYITRQQNLFLPFLLSIIEHIATKSRIFKNYV